MKRISFEDLVRNRHLSDYEQQYAYIMKLLEAGRIKPLLASGKNGKKPALYREYWLIEEKKDTKALEEEHREVERLHALLEAMETKK